MLRPSLRMVAVYGLKMLTSFSGAGKGRPSKTRTRACAITRSMWRMNVSSVSRTWHLALSPGGTISRASPACWTTCSIRLINRSQHTEDHFHRSRGATVDQGMRESVRVRP